MPFCTFVTPLLFKSNYLGNVTGSIIFMKSVHRKPIFGLMYTFYVHFMWAFKG